MIIRSVNSWNEGSIGNKKNFFLSSKRTRLCLTLNPPPAFFSPERKKLFLAADNRNDDGPMPALVFKGKRVKITWFLWLWCLSTPLLSPLSLSLSLSHTRTPRLTSLSVLCIIQLTAAELTHFLCPVYFFGASRR